jgi:hypothetical protein
MANNQPEIPRWLQNLQENSWELELLISGGAVFTLIQFPDLFLNWCNSLIPIVHISGFAVFVIAGLTGIKILTNGFILHLFLRSYWLSMVCLNYVFPQGINKTRPKMKFPFRTKHVSDDLKDQIMRVDQLCGLVIYCSIISTVILLGLSAILGFLILTNWTSFYCPSWLDGILTFLFLSSFPALLIYIIDLVTVGFFRRIPFLSFILYPHFYLFDKISLRPLYERSLVFFGGNILSRRFYPGAFMFLLVTLCTVLFGLSDYRGLPANFNLKRILDNRLYLSSMGEKKKVVYKFYSDEAEFGDRYQYYIPSKIIQSNFLLLNLNYSLDMDRFISDGSDKPGTKNLAAILEVVIDGRVCNSVVWHGRKEKIRSDIGLFSMIPIGDLPNGEHTILVRYKRSKFKSDISDKELYLGPEIPFWKDVF